MCRARGRSGGGESRGVDEGGSPERKAKELAPCASSPGSCAKVLSCRVMGAQVWLLGQSLWLLGGRTSGCPARNLSSHPLGDIET